MHLIVVTCQPRGSDWPRSSHVILGLWIKEFWLGPALVTCFWVWIIKNSDWARPWSRDFPWRFWLVQCCGWRFLIGAGLVTWRLLFNIQEAQGCLMFTRLLPQIRDTGRLLEVQFLRGHIQWWDHAQQWARASFSVSRYHHWRLLRRPTQQLLAITLIYGK